MNNVCLLVPTDPTMMNNLLLVALFASQAFLTVSAAVRPPPSCGTERFPCDRPDQMCQNNNKCVCTNGYVGKVHLGCFDPVNKFCHLTSDPEGKTYAQTPDDPMDMPVPCQFVLSKYQAKTAEGYCNVLAQAVTKRQTDKGKFFVHSLMVGIDYNIAGYWGGFLLRISGSGWNGVYTYELGYRPGGSSAWTTSATSVDMSAFEGANKLGVGVVFETDAYNRVHLKVPRCALDLFFRAMDYKEDVMTVTQMPGVIMGANEEDYQIAYDMFGNQFCFDSTADSVPTAVNALGLDDAQDTFIYRALVSSRFSQTLPFANPQACTNIGQLAYDSCKDSSRFAEAFRKCMPFLLKPEFAGCYSNENDSRDLLSLTRMCLRCYCLSISGQCDEVKQRVDTRGCAGFYTLP